jgi:hypothetical protein
MAETQYRASDVSTLVNDDLAPLGDAQAGVARASVQAKARIARENRAYQPLGASERAARQALQTAQRQRQAADSELDSAVREAYISHYRLRELSEDSLIPFDIVPVADFRSDIGMWWWGESSWWWPGHLFGLSVFDQADGLHFRGQLNYDDGDLWFGSTGVTAIFGIGSDRLPAPGWYRSVPRVNLWGEVWGFTGVSGPLSFGDNWSKCWLHANQKISVAGGPMINQAHWFDTLLFFESDGSHGVRPLPGTFTFPEVFFEVVPGRPLVAELELKFDIQLEGSSAFRFGNYGGWTDAVFQSPQWSLFQ